MTASMLTQSHQSGAGLPGTWRLDGKRAVTLRPREEGVLRVAHGSVWVTFDGPHGGPPQDTGDYFLGAGDRLPVHAGQRLVIESLEAATPAYFSWDFGSAAQPLAVCSTCLQAVGQAWSDLQLALVLGVRASGRLLRAVAGLAFGALRPRPLRPRALA